MKGFDLRFYIPIIINLLKSQSEALPWVWDAFSMLNNHPSDRSWINTSFHVFLLVVFSFTSITLIFLAQRPSPNAALFRFQFGNVKLSALPVWNLHIIAAPFALQIKLTNMQSHNKCLFPKSASPFPPTTATPLPKPKDDRPSLVALFFYTLV